MQDVGSDHRLLSTAKLGRTAWLSQSWNTMDCISRNDMCFPEKWTAILGGGRISLVSLQNKQTPKVNGSRGDVFQFVALVSEPNSCRFVLDYHLSVNKTDGVPFDSWVAMSNPQISTRASDALGMAAPNCA